MSKNFHIYHPKATGTDDWFIYLEVDNDGVSPNQFVYVRITREQATEIITSLSLEQYSGSLTECFF